jgi:hypothetical protein
MQMLMNNTSGLGLLLRLNWDRLLYVATIAVALGAGAWIGALTSQ